MTNRHARLVIGTLLTIVFLWCGIGLLSRGNRDEIGEGVLMSLCGLWLGWMLCDSIRERGFRLD